MIDFVCIYIIFNWFKTFYLIVRCLLSFIIIQGKQIIIFLALFKVRWYFYFQRMYKTKSFE